MTKVAQLLHNAVAAQVRGVDDETKFALSDAMSYFVEGYEHTDAYKSRGWDGKSTLFDWLSAKFPVGFVMTAQTVLQGAGYKVQLLRQPLPPALGPMPTQESPLVDDFPADERYDYQFKGINVLEKHGILIARIATGGGKSRYARLCIKRLGRKTLFLTTRKVLLYQMGEACAASGLKVSYVGDGQFDSSADVVLGMVQTFIDRLTGEDERRAEILELLHEVEFVIGEEAHESGSNSYYEVLKNCRKAHFRLALTATPLMRDEESNMRLIGMFGPVRMEVSEKMLIDRGILATPIFKIIKSEPPLGVRRGSNWQKAEVEGVVRNPTRNRAIIAEAIRAKRWGLSTLCLVKRREHGEILHQMARSAGLRSVYIFGESSKAKRDRALNALRTGDIDVLFGSTILDVGVDVPAIGLMILAGGGKAEVQHRQRIGRGLRAKKSGPNICLVVDFSDSWNSQLSRHSRARRAIIDATPGFDCGILPAGKDFDLGALGFARAKAA